MLHPTPLIRLLPDDLALLVKLPHLVVIRNNVPIRYLCSGNPSCGRRHTRGEETTKQVIRSLPNPSALLIQLADDISVALLTTLWGLGVAIFALSAFAILRNRIDMLTAECALACEKLLAIFKPGTESAAPKPASTATDPLT